MTEKHVYNFSGQGPANPGYLKLWLSHFHEGFFALVRPSAWRIYCRLLYAADFQTFRCKISHSELSKDCGIRRQGIPELIRELELNRLLICQKQITRSGKQPSIYHLSIPETNPPETDPIYAGQVLSNKPIEITIADQTSTPGHVRLSRELFDSGFFQSLGRNHAAWKIYCGLLYRADFEDGFAFPQISTIEKDCMISKPTIIKSLKLLENVSLVEVAKRRTSKGNIANGYYIWPVSSRTYSDGLKNRTSKSKKTGHPEGNISDIRKLNNQTSQDVRKINTNINSRINTTSSSDGERNIDKEKIEDLLTQFYNANPKRMGLKPAAGIQWLSERVKEYGYGLVKHVVTCADNKELFAISRLDGCIESLAWMKQKRFSQKPDIPNQTRLEQPEPEIPIVDQIATKRELIIDYRAKLKDGGPMSRIWQSSVNRLERELAELEEQGS